MKESLNMTIEKMLNDEHDLMMAAITSYRVFKSFMNAGFTEEQALTIVIELIKNK